MKGEDIRTAHGYEIRTSYEEASGVFRSTIYQGDKMVWSFARKAFDEAVARAEEAAKSYAEAALKGSRASHDKAFSLIAEERAAQDEQWGGGEHDKEHTTEEWLTYITKQLNYAAIANRIGRGDEVKERLVKIAALAVAALEASE